jgi:DNA repair protein RadC
VLLSHDLAAGRLFMPLGRLASEVAAVAYLDTENRLIGMRHVMGARSWLHFPIRSIVRDALSLDAWGVVMAHNHPSGHAEPSAADLSFTRRLALCLDAMDIHLLDHLVIAADRMTSLRAEGVL